VKEARHKGHIIYDAIHMKFPEQANPKGQKVDWWFSGDGQRME
jgi:hypothetical protein